MKNLANCLGLLIILISYNVTGDGGREGSKNYQVEKISSQARFLWKNNARNAKK
jgi:hypothetical protein